jgi:hypothetical protein
VFVDPSSKVLRILGAVINSRLLLSVTALFPEKRKIGADDHVVAESNKLKLKLKLKLKFG